MHQTATLASAISLALALAAAQEEDHSKIQITDISTVSGNVYMLLRAAHIPNRAKGIIPL